MKNQKKLFIGRDTHRGAWIELFMRSQDGWLDRLYDFCPGGFIYATGLRLKPGVRYELTPIVKPVKGQKL